MQYILRPYQKAASDAALRAFMAPKSKKKNGVLILPTGAGKSHVIADVAQRLDTQMLIFCPSKEILEQNYKKLVDIGYYDCDVFSASCGRKRIAKVTFATIGSAFNRMEDFRHFKYIMIDECHQGVNPKGGQMEAFLHDVPGRQIVGLTATPYRLERNMRGSELRFITRTKPKIFQEVLYYCQIGDLLAKGYLADIQYFDVSKYISFDINRVASNSTGAEYDDRSLQLEYERSGFLYDIENWTIRVMHPNDGTKRKGTLVFTKFVKEAQFLCDRLNQKGYRAAIVTGDTPKKERDQILNDFREGRIQVVCNAAVLVCGFDYPELDTIVLARPTKSLALYYQMCLSMDTEVLTERGFLTFPEIRKSDKVAAYNNGNIEFVDIEEIIHRKVYAGERFVSFKNQHLDFCVTDHHDMLVRRIWQKEYKKKPAADVADMDNMIYVPVSGEQDVEDCNLKDCELRFLGYFLSDGSLNKINGQIQIVQSMSYPYIVEDIEKTLIECGFKYGKIIQKRKGDETKYNDVVHFTISKGKPRGRCKHLKGWSYLSEYIDKNFGQAYEKLSSRDFSVLLETLNLGDGKKSEYGWHRRTYTIAMGNNKVYADRVQSLAIRRGWRCNMYTQIQNGRSQYICYFKKLSYSTIAGQSIQPVNGNERPKITMFNSKTGDEVWCVKDRYGTIVTRRNGKVIIMGNCGRAIRPFPGKKAWVVDLCSNYKTFGAVSDLRIECPLGTKKYIVTSRGRQLTNTTI